jgi:hypothetical protein
MWLYYESIILNDGSVYVTRVYEMVKITVINLITPIGNANHRKGHTPNYTRGGVSTPRGSVTPAVNPISR